jgi:type VI secretion system protein VasG
VSTSLKTLVSKLDDTCRASAERAAAITMTRGHHEVDIEHLFLALLEVTDSDVSVLCRRFEVSTADLTRDLERELKAFKSGNTRTPVFSSRLPTLFGNAWLIASLEAHDARIRSAHLLLALLTDPMLAQLAHRSSPLFARFDVGQLKHQLDEATRGSREQSLPSAQTPPSRRDAVAADDQPALASQGRTPALDQFTTNLTQRARDGQIDPVIGRETEVRQAIDILMRRRQNNPILTGEAGVGKTAVVEGLALRIAQGDVPEPLRGVSVHTLDLGLLQAGASVKGEFENRLKSVIDEVKRSPHPVVLFIDEAHTMVGAGGQAGQNDAANLLKPALARGELRTIAATTWSEYKKYFERDAALARRFQVVKVEEPGEPIAAAMLRGISPLMERHFKVRIRDEAITEAVRLSARYITGRQLPDKAISVLDTACAKVALGQAATPAAIEDLRKHQERLEAEMQGLQRESATGMPHALRLEALAAERDTAQQRIDTLVERHEAERALVVDVQTLRSALEAGDALSGTASEPSAVADRAGQAAQLVSKLAELNRLQGKDALMPLEVDASVVASIVAAWTGIPLGKMVQDDLKTVLSLAPLLQARVIGQAHAMQAIAQRVRTARANLEDPNKPKGVFLFVGPSGVGKTETALALADLLYGGERKLVTINMSEYQEAHSVSGLKGSPPGYVGFGEGGVLTEAVRRNPYSVVLLDEAEKAHPDVLELFYQVFDKGVLDDAEGREIDFRNCLIILTSNVGSSQIMQACINKPPADYPAADELAEALRPMLYKTFKPAFLGRMKVIPYYAIGDEVLEKIIRLKLDRIVQRVHANHGASFAYDAKLVEAVLARCTEVDSGARNVDHILNGTLLPEVAGQVLEHMAEGRKISRIKVSASKNGDFKYTVTTAA